MQIDRKYTLETLARLVQTNSINPTLAPGAPGEKEIAAFVAESLRRLRPDCGDVRACARSNQRAGTTDGHGRRAQPDAQRALRHGGRRGHGRTVQRRDPRRQVIRPRRLRYEGLAGRLHGSRQGAEGFGGTRLRGDVLVAAVADEEYGSLGTSDLITHVKVDGAIVTEPTALEVCLAHKGYLWIEVLVAGRAAHGSKFELGIDANMKMGHFLGKLSDLERDLRSRPPHPLVGPPSLHAAMLSGGTGLSTYARFQHGADRAPHRAGRNRSAGHRGNSGHRGSAGRSRIRISTPRCGRSSCAIRSKCRRARALYKAVDRAAAKVRGCPAAHIGDTPWMDAALLQAAGVETVVCGARGAGAHADVEWVDVESVIQLAEILAEAAVDYCA